MICRILLFYVLSILLIGLNGVLNHRCFICRINNFLNSSMGLPEFIEQERNNLTIHYCLRASGIQYVLINFTRTTDTHTFAAVAASFMNTVVMTSVLSAGNHALFAGTRVLYGKCPIIFLNPGTELYNIGLATTVPPQAPTIFSRTTSRGIPLPALLMTSSISILCFGSSFIGSGELWSWLQNLVGVSNQVPFHLTSLNQIEILIYWHLRLPGFPSGSLAGGSARHGKNKDDLWMS